MVYVNHHPALNVTHQVIVLVLIYVVLMEYVNIVHHRCVCLLAHPKQNVVTMVVVARNAVVIHVVHQMQNVVVICAVLLDHNAVEVGVALTLRIVVVISVVKTCIIVVVESAALIIFIVVVMIVVRLKRRLSQNVVEIGALAT